MEEGPLRNNRPLTSTRLLRLVLTSLLVVFSEVYAQSDSGLLVTTVAGNGTLGFSGDGGLATVASLGHPYGVAVDASGNHYIADTGSHRIRKVSPAGIISTIAGNGTRGSSGDGGLATAASLSDPWGMAVDASGNLYIADTGNRRIRKVSPDGIIRTVAGNVDATAVAVDASGNLYIADTRQIRKVSPDGIISTVAGTADAIHPGGVALDASGNLYIADQGNCIRKVSPAGIISTFAGSGTQGFSGDGGPATAASLNNPFGVAVDAAGNLYIADTFNYRIRKVSPAGIISTVAGDGVRNFSGDGLPATMSSLYDPLGVTVDASGNLYIADMGNNRIRKLVPSQSPAVGCVYSIDANTQSFGLAGGSGSVAVLVNQVGCPWLAGSYVDWITVASGSSGSGNGVVTYFVAPNGNSASRTGSLWIAGKTFTVTQPGLTCSYRLDPSSLSVPPSGVIGSKVGVSASAPDCRWSASSSAGWILVSGGTSGTGGGTVTYTVGINSGTFRSGNITVAGQAFTVNQASAVGVPPVISAEGVLNAATSLGGAVAPGEFVSVYGVGMGPSSRSRVEVHGKGGWHHAGVLQRYRILSDLRLCGTSQRPGALLELL